MPRIFNTSGPCDPERHYMLPATARLPNLQAMFDRSEYFVIHAPRQTGKTTAMKALAESLRAQGLAACWVSLEAARRVDDVASAEPIWLQAIELGARARRPRAGAPPTQLRSSPGRRGCG